MSAEDTPLFRGGASTRRRSGLLLAVIGTAFFFLGVAPAEDWARVVITILAGAILLLSFRVADMPRRRLGVAAILVAVAVAGAIAAILAADGDSVAGVNAIIDGLLLVLAPPAVAVGVVRSLRAHGAVTMEAVFGALCMFMFVGLLFAFAYIAIDRLGGDPFFAESLVATPSRAVYFSFTTITTVGYGDLTARTDLGHTLSATEALIGQIYLVTVVAVIVSNLAPRRSGRD